MKKITLGVCVGLLIASFSCKQQTEKQYTKNELAFDTINVSEKHFFNNDTAQTACNLSVEFVYPVQNDNDSIVEKMQREIILMYFEDEKYTGVSPKDAVDKYVSDFNSSFDATVKGYENHMDEFDGNDPFFTASEKLLGHLLFNEGGFLTFQVERQNSKMGTITHTQYKNCVIDLETGERIKEEDIFVEDYEQEIHDLFVVQLLKVHNVKQLSDLENDEYGYINLEEIVPNRNFGVDGKGITYVFNSGEYSTYKTEAIRILLPFEEIKHLIKENSPIFRLID
ncbi:RsiV family protein [Dysgonomonas sp. 520]|uniref:RsiV family protein n=1 Tax=Dysgonomonas sp. 520 TaxID=2302931 RepID=UPI0013D744D3|nr:RsiV family protein [Dysgonomonas sp. 520]NDW09948.1 DUF3298 domain-containing protein [Dysgonomonas sp. 520]